MDKEKLKQAIISHFETDNEYAMDDMERVAYKELMNWIERQNPSEDEILYALRKRKS